MHYELPVNLQIKDELYNNVIQTVHSRADEILSKPLHIHYPDHSIKHSERILLCIDKLIDNMSHPLNDEEKFILVCAVLLHDIGLQAPNYYPEPLGNVPLDDVALEKIRDIHHELSKKMIIDSVAIDNHHNTIDLGLSTHEKTRRSAEMIAVVAEYHRKLVIGDVEEDNGIRKKLLCSLMRIGDCLDCDFNRVNLESLKRISIDLYRKPFWYSHYYVEKVNITNQKIKIYFRFPNSYQEEKIKDAIILHIKNDIKRHINDVYQHLYNYDLRIFNDVEYHIGYSTVVEELPADVRESMEVKNEEYKSEGFGEIDFYWGGDRETSNNKIIEYLSKTKSNDILIAAIGFGTINSVLENSDVISNFYKLIKKSKPGTQFKITFILPDSNDDLKVFRPELSEEQINESYKYAQSRLSTFRRTLADVCFPDANEDKRLKKIAPYIELKKYNKKDSMPRHFILHGSDDTIFVGSYLGHTTGKKSYLMKLKPYKSKPKDDDNYKLGLFDLFTREILYIKSHSVNTDLKLSVKLNDEEEPHKLT